MMHTNDLLRYGQAVGGRFRDSFRRAQTRPVCPRCPSTRSLRVVRIDIEELPGHPMIEQRDWRCGTCGATVRESITA